MGRSRSRSRSPRRGNERERIMVRRSRSRSRERENRRRERDQRPDRRREPERERPERMERERMPMARDRRRSRSPSPGGGRWQRGRSPPGRRISDSPPPKKYSSNEPVERREIDESQLEGKTEEEIEMMKTMGFCGFDTTKGKAAEQQKKPDLITPATPDSQLGSEWLETSTETRTVFIRGEKLVTDTETRTFTISDKKPRKSEERSSHSEPESPEGEPKAEKSPLMKNKKQKKKKKKKLKKEKERVSNASDLTDSHSPIVKLEGTSCDTLLLEVSGKENIAVSDICLENIPLPPGPPTESKKRSSLVPRSVSLNRLSATPKSPQTSDDVFNKPIDATPKLDFSHVTPSVNQASDTSTRNQSSFQPDTPKSHHRDSPMSRGNRSFEGNRSYENHQRRHSSSSRFSPATPGYSEGYKNYPSNSSSLTRGQSEGFRNYPATPHSINRRASYCTKCFEEGHYVRDCKNPKRCRVCRVLGHYPGSLRCEYYTDSPYIMPFQGASDILSNFFPCNITIYAEEFHSSEQAYQYKKAVEWNMTSVAEQIMAAPTARDVKVLCNRALKGPPGDHEEFKLSIMREVLRAKALQVPAYRDLLMDADPKMVFGEATTDLYWATGLVREETRNTCPERWPGKNTLGKLHHELAEELKNGEHSFGQSNQQKYDPPKDAANRKDEEAEKQCQSTRKRRSSSSSSASSKRSSLSHTTYSSSSDSESSDDSYSRSKKKRKQRSSSKGSKYKVKSKMSSKSKSVKSERISKSKKSKGKKSKRKRYSSSSSSSAGDGKRKARAPTSPSLKDTEMPCKKKKSDL